jgi:hypothetical protein
MALDPHAPFGPHRASAGRIDSVPGKQKTQKAQKTIVAAIERT